MTRRSCSALAELRSAFVDGAITDGDRDRLLQHLADCGSCRREVDDLRDLRGLLRASGPVPVGTGQVADLSERLRGIAGPEARTLL